MIIATDLTKRYGARTAVDRISFRAEPGCVTGFLGPNGAGKSTTLRMVAGLTPPTSGGCTVLGRPYARLNNPGRHVGVLLDAAAQHPGRTGHELLRLGAILMGLPRQRVDAVLELVGLAAHEGDRRIGDYSLGMRQRLGIAHALLGDPQVLVLDEPANGLDPAGIRWMRRLLGDFAERGGTVLLSSHLLHEIELVAHHVIVIAGGRLVADGSTSDLLGAAGTLVRATATDDLVRCLDAAGLHHTGTADGARIVRGGREPVARAVAAGGLVITELRAVEGGGLEDLFLGLTADDARDADVA